MRLCSWSRQAGLFVVVPICCHDGADSFCRTLEWVVRLIVLVIWFRPKNRCSCVDGTPSTSPRDEMIYCDDDERSRPRGCCQVNFPYFNRQPWAKWSLIVTMLRKWDCHQVLPPVCDEDDDDDELTVWPLPDLPHDLVTLLYSLIMTTSLTKFTTTTSNRQSSSRFILSMKWENSKMGRVVAVMLIPLVGHSNQKKASPE